MGVDDSLDSRMLLAVLAELFGIAIDVPFLL
jgi:hypothetical protein